MANGHQQLDLSTEQPTDRAEVLFDTQRTRVSFRWFNLRLKIDDEGAGGSPIHLAIAVLCLALAGILPGGIIIAVINAFTPISGVLAIGIATALFIVVFTAGFILFVRSGCHHETPPAAHTLNGHGKPPKPRSIKRR